MKNYQSWLLLILTTLVGFLFITALHSIITPFLLAGIVAFLLHPLVRQLEKKFHTPHLVAVILVYVSTLTLIIFATINITFLLSREYKALNSELRHLPVLINNQILTLPEWGQDFIDTTVNNFRVDTFLSPNRVWPYFSGALTRIGTMFIFLVATFYFLKDGSYFVETLMTVLPRSHEIKSKLMTKIYQTLNDYLRGQVILILLMSSVSWIALSILHVKYAMILALFTGVAEIVPIIGPITAGAVATFVAIVDGVNVLPSPLLEGLTVALLYLIFRQIEDAFVIPYVLGKATKLHPLIILFAVLVGGHVWGIFGMVLAVPLAAILQLFLRELT